jgi:CheY-like chemotaxis protein
MNMSEFPESFPHSEKPIDDSEQVTHDWTVEALIVAVNDDSEVRYVITRVLEGHDKVYDTFYKHVKSAQSGFLLAPEDHIADYSYRQLQEYEYYYRYVEDEHPYSDYFDILFSDTPVEIGDRVNIVRWTRTEPSADNVWGGSSNMSWTLHHSDVVTILESGMNIREEEDRNLERRTYLRKNLAAILHRLEQLQLKQRQRIQPNEDASIGWIHNEQRDAFRAEFVYGNEPIKDHFVTVRAEHAPTEDVPLGGDMRLTTTGRAFLGREITAGQPSKELVITDEPLFELSADIKTETEFNPEVNDARVDFIVDGIRYTGILDIEQSTRSFRNPGHHLHFETFAVVGEAFDGIEIPETERDAIFRFRDELSKLRMRAMRIGIDGMTVFKEIGGSITSKNITPAHGELYELKLAAEAASKNIKPVIDQIKATPSNLKLGLGGKLLVPQSKLASVRVIMGQKGDGFED